MTQDACHLPTGSVFAGGEPCLTCGRIVVAEECLAGDPYEVDPSVNGFYRAQFRCANCETLMLGTLSYRYLCGEHLFTLIGFEEVTR